MKEFIACVEETLTTAIGVTVRSAMAGHFSDQPSAWRAFARFVEVTDRHN